MIETDALMDDQQALSTATLEAASILGLNRQQLSRVIGRDRSRLTQGIPIESKSAELAVLLIRCHRALHTLFDGDEIAMAHWMSTANTAIDDIPLEHIQQIHGLTRVLDYLEAMLNNP